MDNIIDGIHVIEQSPIKEPTYLSDGVFFTALLSLFIAFCTLYALKVKIKMNNRAFKVFLIWFFSSLAMMIFGIIQFSFFYKETGRYTYTCTVDDAVSAEYIINNFNVVSVEDNVWTIEDKK